MSKILVIEPWRVLVHVTEYLEIVEGISDSEIDALLAPAFEHIDNEFVLRGTNKVVLDDELVLL